MLYRAMQSASPDGMERKSTRWVLSIQNCAISINFHNGIDATSSAVVTENSESGEKPPEFALTRAACFAKFGAYVSHAFPGHQPHQSNTKNPKEPRAF
jgi:hypothetical protein